MSNKIYPIGVQNFESLRKDGFFYVDKTALIYQLANSGRYYFLNRPRRFVKSLLLSTLEAYFEGKKELFEGLALEKLEKDWIKYPILHIDLNTEKYNTPESLERILNFTLLQWEKLYGTGTPSYLVELLKRTDYNLYNMAHTETNADVLNSIDAASQNPIPVIYQSGYLTIKDYDPEFQMYTLGFPNQEVEEGFVRYLLPFYTSVTTVDSAFEIQYFVKDIRKGDVDAFFQRLQSFFADTPYELVRNLELHYQNVLFIVFKLAGFYTKVEYHIARGRIDLVLQTDRYIYVMEFKLNGTAEEALQQINEKGYAESFAVDDRKVVKIGVNFSSETRNIERWIVEP